MKFAFLLFKYFPESGLARDALALAGRLTARGHAVELIAGDWRGPRPATAGVTLLGRRGWTNHGRDADFARRAPAAATGCDAAVGFNRMPGLDIHYAADPCLAAALARRPAWQRWTPRNRARLAFERAVFGPAAATRSLLLSPQQPPDIAAHYGTPAERWLLLPPAIGRDRRRPPDAPAIRQAARTELGVAAEDWLLLALGSHFRTKGVDRTVRALADLPAALRRRTRLAVVGQGKTAPLVALAGRLGIADRLLLLGARDDVPRLLLAADLLVHPARLENTGQAILEAIVAGLPVLAGAACGFAPHVERAGAGLVLPEPFAAGRLAADLAGMLEPGRLAAWSANGAAYGRTADLYGGLDAAAAAIERWTVERLSDRDPRPAGSAARSR
jgi:UDP-glucose:(heptosyl)LPS alpha-1,3-glucosyltransferase